MGPIFRDTTPSGSLLSADGHNTAACPCVQRPRSSGKRPLPVGGRAGPRRLVSSFRHPGRQQGGHRQQQGQRDPAAPATIQLRPRQGPGQAPAPPPLRRPRQQLPAAGAHHAAGQAAIGLHRPAPAVGDRPSPPLPHARGIHARRWVAISAAPDRPLAARAPRRDRAATRSRRSRIPGPRSRSPGSRRRGCGRPATSRRGPPARR